MAKQIKLKETPLLAKEDVFEVVQDNTNPKSPEMIIYHTKSIIEDCSVWGSVVQVSEWANNTGYDITLCGRNGSFQHLSITKEEAEIMNKAINKLSMKYGT